ncbi:HK97-gp10 family putative phage morphogenesis protein [uncultured Clostridium sp.]|uniref:HK97-gp10 family putative phage morphogenesis protein n=1 Tax=uncultured Clostridium sp. TaxID=59620 RepID=UPI002603E493|nr:HK97-gp10 family putative phage morphogenesis protein [uncultured Clostridium sp.]
MGLPKSVVKFKKGNVEYISNVDKVNYTLNELTRAALRDVGKFVCNRFRSGYYSVFSRKKGKVGRYVQYWVRRKNCDLQVGIKPSAFYGGFQEFGSSKTAKVGLLQKTVKENIPKIVEIESKYLSALESEAQALAMIAEEEYQGGAED